MIKMARMRDGQTIGLTSIKGGMTQIHWECDAKVNLLTSEILIRPSWKEQVVGSCVQRLRYLHQWQRKALLTQDRHLQRGDSKRAGKVVTYHEGNLRVCYSVFKS
jgi:hypothetical protein